MKYIHKNLITLLLTCLCALTHFTLLAQTAKFEKPKIISPEVASLMKYVEYPVNLNTGLVNISIPLYEIKIGDINIPITISYHASGIKANELNGRLGLGWSLNAESSVSRNINGMPDEVGYLSHLGRNNYNRNWHNYEIMWSDGRIDEEPDAFYYKLGDKSGKFYFKRDLKTASAPVVVPHPWEPIKISYTISNYLFSKFDIVDERGIKYKFGQASIPANNAYSITDSKFTQWKVTEITGSSGKHKVDFYYGNYTYNIQQGLNDYLIIEDIPEVNLPSGTPGSFFGCSGLSWPFISRPTRSGNNNIDLIYDQASGTYTASEGKSVSCDISFPISGTATSVSEKPIKIIESSLEKVEFFGESELGKIIVTCKTTNKPLRTINFYYSNYSNTASYKRRKLDRVEITDSQGTIVEKYAFGYYMPQYLPYLNSNAIDHWGYYNYTNNEAGTPYINTKVRHYPNTTTNRYETNFSVPGCTKEPHPEAMQYGLLNSITYPTGRNSSFEYEINRDSYNKPTGGLRIKKITENNPLGNGIKRVFKYGEKESGKGVEMKSITSDDYMYEKLCFQGGIDYKISRSRIYRSTPITTFSFDGASVYYPEIAEYFEENGHNGGKTVYNFANINNNTYVVPETTISYDADNGWSGGKLTKKVIYKSSGSLYSPTETNTYSYKEFKNSLIHVRKIYDRLMFRQSVGTDYDKARAITSHNGFVIRDFYINSGCLKLVGETKTIHDGLTPFTTTQTYEYGNLNHMAPTKVTVSKSTGDNQVITNTYPSDVSYSAGSNEELGRSKLIENNIVAVIESTNTNGTNSQITKHKYKVENGIPVLQYISENTGIGGAEENRIKINKWTDSGKPMEITDTDGVTAVYLWCNKGEYLAMEIKGITYAELRSKYYSTRMDAGDITDYDYTQIRSLYSADKNVFISSYKYKPLVGITSATDPSGHTTTYDYDSFGRLEQIKDHNGNILQKYKYNYIKQ